MHAALDEATKGFQEALTDKLGDEVAFDVQIAQGSTQDCQEILNGFIADEADMILELVPEAEKVGILYCSAETNSIYQAQKMTSILTDKGITIGTYTIADKTELEKTAQKAASECDVLYIPTDNTIASEADVLKKILISEKRENDEGISCILSSK